MVSTVAIFNGPNLNLLGTRETEIYGRDSLADIESECASVADGLDLEIDFRQSNDEGKLVGWIQEMCAAGLILNAGAYTHTSVAILDALRANPVPVVEVHLSNIHQRESFRRRSYVSLAARGVICGFGPHGYTLALNAMAKLLHARKAP